MGLFVSYHKLTDEALMKRLQNQDVKAFDELYHRYYSKLYGFVLKMLKYNKPSSDDIIQEVFLKLYQYPERFDISKKFKPWIYTVVANDCRKSFRIKELAPLEEANSFFIDSNSDNTVDLSEFMKKLNLQLNKVSLEQKEVFILKHQAGFSLKEIAEIQNCALGTVKSRLHSVTKTLAEELEPHKEKLLHL